MKKLADSWRQEFEKQDLSNMQQRLYDILNKNMMYIPVSLMQDSEYNISQADINITNDFYNKGGNNDI